jgi:hypothetical protein
MLLSNFRFHSARYYLFCHAFELILKSFILSAGEDQSKLFGVGHRLNEALAEATRLGYSPSDVGLASIVDWLHPFHEGNDFRYARGGYQMLPTAENILTAFKTAHLEIAPLARTANLKKYPPPV